MATKTLKKQICIKINELPPRPYHLSSSEYENVFGGACGKTGNICSLLCNILCCRDEGYYCLDDSRGKLDLRCIKVK
jgi:hypothetical protein